MSINNHTNYKAHQPERITEGKTFLLYLVLHSSIPELIKGNIFFVSKSNAMQMGKFSKNILKNESVTQAVKDSTIRCIRKIEALNDALVVTSHEMLVYITLNYLINEIKDLRARNYFGHLDFTKILGKMEEKYPAELLQHNKFFNTLLKGKI